MPESGAVFCPEQQHALLALQLFCIISLLKNPLSQETDLRCGSARPGRMASDAIWQRNAAKKSVLSLFLHQTRLCHTAHPLARKRFLWPKGIFFSASPEGYREKIPLVLQPQVLIDKYDFGLHAERCPVRYNRYAADPVRRVAVITRGSLSCAGRLSSQAPGIQRT